MYSGMCSDLTSAYEYLFSDIIGDNTFSSVWPDFVHRLRKLMQCKAIQAILIRSIRIEVFLRFCFYTAIICNKKSGLKAGRFSMCDRIYLIVPENSWALLLITLSLDFHEIVDSPREVDLSYTIDM